MHAQGLCHVEIRFAPQLHTQKGLTQKKVVEACLSGLAQGIRDFGISAGMILCCMRGAENRAQNIETIAVAGEYLGRGVCGVDLAGNEAAYPTKAFAEIFCLAKKTGIPAVIHAGEAAGAESVREALALGAVRIGHGIHAMEDPELMRSLRDKKIYLEMCYSSNLQTKAVNSPPEYPLEKFMENGINVTVNTDNMTVSDTDLKKEYGLLQDQLALKKGTLKQLALNAAEGAFVTEGERATLRAQIEREFFTWLG